MRGRSKLIERGGEAEHGITTQLPNTIEKSLFALSKDEVLKKALGEHFVENYLALKDAERKKLDGFGDEKRRLWLMERY